MLPKNFYSQFESEYAQFKQFYDTGLVKFEMPFEKPGCQTALDGHPIVSFASNDYLSMLNQPEILEVAKNAIDDYGTGAGSSMLGSGSLAIHHELEEELADFFHKEGALLFPTGFSAMLGLASAHISNGAAIFNDSANHRSIIDGLMLGEGLVHDFEEAITFQHNSVESLEKKYKKFKDKAIGENYTMLLIEGVYSMNGDQGNLKAFAPFCKANDMMIAIDDAHGIGVLGDHGRGLASHLGLDKEVDFIAGTFSKTFACTGGFIVGPKDALEYLRLLCGVYMFSASIVPANVQVARRILKIMREDDHYRQGLWDNIKTMRDGLDSYGFDYGSSDSAVIPVYIRDTEKVLLLADKLLKAGYYVVAAIPPGVGEGEQLIRVSMNYAHRDDQIAQFLETLDVLATELDIQRKL